MKRIFFVRHAKAVTANIGDSDFERVLDSQGKTQAAIAASALAESVFSANERVDAVVCSPAVRAKSTAAYFISALNHNDSHSYESQPLQTEEYAALYGATYEQVSKVIKGFPETWQTVVLVGHNPSLADIKAFIEHNWRSDMHTASVFDAKFEVETWYAVKVQ